MLKTAVFGHSCEQVKNRMELKLTKDNDKAIKLFSKLHFKSSEFIYGSHTTETITQDIIHDKHSYVGTSVSDLSNMHMMRLHYDAIHAKFGNLICSDTDSLVHDIRHFDIYICVGAAITVSTDLSYSKGVDLKDDTNKNVAGRFKDELGFLLITELLALSPKVYSMHIPDLGPASQEQEDP